MTILFLTRLFYPHIGGVERHVVEMSGRLVEIGHKIVIVSESFTSKKSRSSPRHHPKCLKAYQISAGKDDWFKKFRIWWWMWKNRKLIEQADIVHAHDVGFWYFPFRFLYSKKPFFITFHGYEKYPPTKKAILIRKISEKLAKGNICVGDYIRKWYGTKTDYVTYGGVSFFPPPRGSTTHTPEVSLPLVFIGRLSEDTGLLIYLKTWKKARNKLRYSKLVFLGDGNLRKEAEKYGKVLGFVEDVRPYILKSRFVFTSGYLSIFEAMMAKKLIFALFNNPLKEDYLKLAPFSKWIIIGCNPEDMYNKLVYYTQHPEEEEKLVKEAYDWVKEQTWEKVVNLYLKLWKL